VAGFFYHFVRFAQACRAGFPLETAADLEQAMLRDAGNPTWWGQLPMKRSLLFPLPYLLAKALPLQLIP
jgi:hypothetical protein